MKNMNLKVKLRFIVWVAPFMVFFLIAGCATPKINPVLAKARASYLEAKENPDISKNAAVALYEAEKTLEKAEKAKNVKSLEREANRAYRQVQVAVAQSEKKMAENKINLLTKENESLLLERARRQADQRASEADQALQLAERKVQEAAQYRTEAEQMRTLAQEKAMKAEQASLEAERAKEELLKLQQDLEELQAKQTDRGIVLTLGDVLFETAKAELQPGAVRTIEKLAEFLLNTPNRNALVEGHTDSRGSDEFNLGLSERRADSVRRALINAAVPPERITIKGYGKRFPVAGNDTEAGRQQNRRVEIVILNEGVKAESTFR